MITFPLRRAIAVFVFALAALGFTAEDAFATHFRYGTISWSTPNPAQPNVIRVRFDAAFRWSFPWSGPPNACPPGFVPSNPSVGSGSCPPIGTTIAAGSIGNITSSVAVNINGGPASTSIPINNFIVTSINQLEDWMTGTFEVTLTFPATVPGTYTLSFTNCCRVSTLLGGNADANYTVRSTVTVRNPVNRPPTSASLPLIRVPHNVTNATFVIPAFDPDGDPLIFSIPPTTESGLNQSTPPGLTLNSATGVVTWNTTPPAVVLNGLYSAQFKVTDSKGASTVVDVMLSPSAGVGAPPTVYINGAAAPATINVLRGTPMSFPVAVVAGVVTPVTLGSSALPLGASMLPSLPTQGLSGNVSSTFSWTPAPNQVGSYLISYSGITGSGQQAAQTVNINVTNNPPTITCSANGGVIPATGPAGAPFSATAAMQDPDGDALVYQVFIDGVSQGPAATVASPFNLSYSSTIGLGNHTYQIKVTDNFSPTVNCSGTFSIVDATAPSLMLPADATIFATSPGGAPHVYTVSASDAIDSAPSVSCTPASGSSFPVGTTSVACTATDASGNATSGSFEVTVYRRVSLMVSPAAMTAGDVGEVVAMLFGTDDGSRIEGQTVEFSFGGVIPPAVATTDVAGNATIAVNFPLAGSFTATATFLNAAAFFTDHAGTIPVVAEVATAPVTVQAAATSLSLSAASVEFVGGSLAVNAVLNRTSSPTGPVSAAPVLFTLTGPSPSSTVTSLPATTDANGAASVNFVMAARGQYSLSVSFAGDAALLPASRFADVTAYQRTILILSNAVATAGGSATVSAQLASVPGGSPIAGEVVNFSFNGVVTDQSAVTGGNGVATVTVTFANAGTVPATASFQNLAGYFADANGQQIPSTASGTVTVTPAATALALMPLPATAFVGDLLPVTSMLARTSAPAGPVAGGTVTYTQTSPAGTTATTSTTDGSGASTVTLPLATAGLYTVQAQFAGDSALSAVASTVETVAVSQRTALSLAAVNATAGTPVTVTATLMRVPQMTEILNASVEFDFGGVIPNAVGVTNVAGVATVTVTFPIAGTFPMLASFAGSSPVYALAASSSAFATVADGTAPVISYALNGTPGSNGWYTSDVTVNWTVTDPESAISAQTGCDAAVINTDGSLTLTCTATSAGGTETASVTVKRDATVPVLTTASSQTVSATGPATPVNYPAATAVDPTSGISSVACSPASGSAFPLGATTVSCLASDAAGNEATGSFVVTVNDTTPPVLTLPDDITLPGTNPAGLEVTWAASAIDAVSGPAVVTCTPPSGSMFGYGATTVNCTVADTAGNTSSGSFTVTVTDNTPPVVTPAVTGTLGGNGWYTSDVNLSWTVTDAESNVTSTGCGPVVVNADGTATITCSATSEGGTTSVDVGIARDATAPSLSTTAPGVTEATSAAGAMVTYAAAVSSDATSGLAGTPTCTPASGQTFALGTTAVSCTVKDKAGNMATSTFDVVVVDTTTPLLTVSTNIAVIGDNPSGKLVSFTATATDAVTANPTVTCTPASGSMFGYGTTTVTCTAADAAGNTSSGNFTVTVKDNTPPVVTPSLTGTLGGNGWYTSDVNLSWTVTDPESNVTSSGCGPVVVNADGTASFTCSATSEGGTTTVAQQVKRDVTAPAVTTSAPLTASAVNAGGAPVSYTAASAVDPASGVNGTPVCVPASGSTFALGASTVTCTVADNAGNIGTASFSVTVRDTTAPVITATAPSTGSMWPPNHQMVPVTVSVASTDNVTAAPVCTITGVTSNEPQNGLGDGDTPNDWTFSGLSVQLRAERAGNGNGRIYTIAVQCADASGNTTNSTTAVSVPKSQKK